MTVRDLQDALELDSPQSIYKMAPGESFPSSPNMLVLGELFQVPLETLLIREDGVPPTTASLTAVFRTISVFSSRKKDDFSSNRRSKHVQICLREITTQKAFTHSQEHPDPEVPHN